jgi:hypothetical protein
MNRVRAKAVTTYHVIGGKVVSADRNSILIEYKGKTYEAVPVAGAEHEAWLLAGHKQENQRRYTEVPIETVTGGIITNASYDGLTVMKEGKYYIAVAYADWPSVWMEVYELEAPILA